MPQRILTLPQMLLRQQRDVYFIRFYDARDGKSRAMREMQRWLKHHLPQTAHEPLGFRPGDGLHLLLQERWLWVDFDADSLKLFCASWENDQGDSIDERFQCCEILWSAAENWAKEAVAADEAEDWG